MTHHDHINFQDRVRKLAASAIPTDSQVCHCRTCGVVNARLRGALTARGWSHAETHHVHVDGYDFRGTCDPYLAVAKVDSEEIARAYSSLDELLEPGVLDLIEAALRRHHCSP